MLTVHGSMARDMDLIAVPWVDNPQKVEKLVEKLNECLGETAWKDHNLTDKEERTHHRVTYTLKIGGDWFVDLTVVEPKGRSGFSMNGFQRQLYNSFYRFTSELSSAVKYDKDLERIAFDPYYRDFGDLQEQFDYLKQQVGFAMCIIDEDTGVCLAEKFDEKGLDIDLRFVEQDDEEAST